MEGLNSSKTTFSFDVAGSTSVNTLNESSSSMSTSKAISVNIPSFGYTATCCDYAFGGYVFGLQNLANPASENACAPGQTPQENGCTEVNDPGTGKPIDIASTGPMFVGFLADPISNVRTQIGDLHCSGSASWWQTVYTAPDIALNHPGRWNWNQAKQLATFVKPNSTPIIEDNYFYLMKGFFISKKGNKTGPNLVEASPSDTLTLSARVYNYSLANTTGKVYVRFYGQLYCTSPGSGEGSCKSGNTTCTTPGLCGNSFLIGVDTIGSIAGFKAIVNGNETASNWALATVDFEPGNFPAVKTGNAYMVFWVVAWMEDNGKLVAEMPGHGLKSLPGANLTGITQVPVEPYSNNIGMYGVHQHFYVCPPSGCYQPNSGVGATPSNGSLKTITISADARMLLEQRNKVGVTLQAAGGSVGPVNIAYYDGNPAKGGTLLDIQQIQHMDPGVPYAHRSFFTPETCGAHSLYASAWTANSAEIQASSATRVSIDSIDFVQALINSTQTANITERWLSRRLLDMLNVALQEFQQGQTDAGNTALSAYVEQLAFASGNGISAERAGQLTGQASVILGCGARGFSLVASPSSATLSVGSPASYALAITPIGGFRGNVALACIGAPKGVHCSFSSPSVALDGTSQSRVPLTVTAGGSSPERHKRRRKPVHGTYSFTVQAISGRTIRNTTLTLVVK